MIRPATALRLFSSVLLALALSISVFADTIRLKDGSLIKGTIVGFTDGRFILVVGEGTRKRELSLDAAEIASIEFEDRTAAVRQNSGIVPVSTRPAPKVVVSENSPSQTRETPGQRTASSTLPAGGTQPSIPPASRPAGSTNKTIPPVTSRSQPSSLQPVLVNVRVLADNTANGWTNSGWIVKKGQRIRISGSGTVSLGRGKTSEPSGLAELEDDQKLLKAVPTGALIAVIGDDNNDFIYIGEEREFTAGRDGALYLGVNEGNLNDNTGAYNVKVEIMPGS